MKVFKFIFGHRGADNSLRRGAQIVRRFGATPARMGARFERFMDVLEDFGVRPTFPITALPMSRNDAFARRLLERGAELAVHAWSHIDLTTLDYPGQAEHMGMAVRLFREHGVPFTGFRAPYLHWNEDTMRAVEAFKFRYSSNQTIWWDVIDEKPLDARARDGLARGIAFYNPLRAEETRALPVRRRGFVEIPVSLPDDEIPLDRMYVDDEAFLGAIWSDILEHVYERGELFTLQLHPERIDFFTGALRGLLGAARAKKPPVWIATLDEIAQWWIDKAYNRADFARDGSGYRASVRASEGATITVREDGKERAVEPGIITLAGAERPCVGVAPGSDRAALQVLADLGYVVEVGDDVVEFAVHLGRVDDAAFDTITRAVAAIERCPGPLVRFGTWPRGARAALAVTGDIDALTIWDFVHRFRGA